MQYSCEDFRLGESQIILISPIRKHDVIRNTIDIIANGTGLETDDVMRTTSVTGARFLDPV